MAARFNTKISNADKGPQGKAKGPCELKLVGVCRTVNKIGGALAKCRACDRVVCGGCSVRTKWPPMFTSHDVTICKTCLPEKGN